MKRWAGEDPIAWAGLEPDYALLWLVSGVSDVLRAFQEGPLQGRCLRQHVREAAAGAQLPGGGARHLHRRLPQRDRPP